MVSEWCQLEDVSHMIDRQSLLLSECQSGPPSYFIPYIVSHEACCFGPRACPSRLRRRLGSECFMDQVIGPLQPLATPLFNWRLTIKICLIVVVYIPICFRAPVSPRRYAKQVNWFSVYIWQFSCPLEDIFVFIDTGLWARGPGM